MKEKSIKVNMFLNTLRVSLSLIFPLITFPYVSRILSAENIGKVQFGSSIIAYVSLIAMLGINAYAVREGSPLRNDKKKFGKFANQVFSINLITTFISYLILAIIIFLPTKISFYRNLILIQSLTLLFTTIGVDWIYTIYEDYAYITKKSIFTQILSLLLLFLFIKKSDDYYLYAFISVIAGVGVNIFNFIHVKKYCKLGITTNLDIKKHLKPMFLLFSNELAIKTYVNSDIIILGFMTNDFTVGIYSVSVKIYSIVKSLINAMIGVTIPRLAVYNNDKEKKKRNDLSEAILKMAITFIIPAIIGINILSKEIVIIISGSAYLQAYSSLNILSFALIFSVLGNFLTNGILIIHKKEKQVLLATVIAAITNVILNFLIIPILKENGAALTTVIAEAIVVIITFVYAKKIFRFPNMTKTILTSLVGCITIFLYSLIIKAFIPTNILEIILIVFGSIILYIITLFILKNEIVVHYFNVLKNKYNKIKS